MCRHNVAGNHVLLLNCTKHCCTERPVVEIHYPCPSGSGHLLFGCHCKCVCTAVDPVPSTWEPAVCDGIDIHRRSVEQLTLLDETLSSFADFAAICLGHTRDVISAMSQFHNLFVVRSYWRSQYIIFRNSPALSLQQLAPAATWQVPRPRLLLLPSSSTARKTSSRARSPIPLATSRSSWPQATMMTCHTPQRPLIRTPTSPRSPQLRTRGAHPWCQTSQRVRDEVKGQRMGASRVVGGGTVCGRRAQQCCWCCICICGSMLRLHVHACGPMVPNTPEGHEEDRVSECRRDEWLHSSGGALRGRPGASAAVLSSMCMNAHAFVVVHACAHVGPLEGGVMQTMLLRTHACMNAHMHCSPRVTAREPRWLGGGVAQPPLCLDDPSHSVRFSRTHPL